MTESSLPEEWIFAQAAQDPDFALQQSAAEVPQVLNMRASFLLNEQKFGAAAESAAKRREWAGGKAVQLYDAACAYALCGGRASVVPDPDEGTNFGAPERLTPTDH
jgi:hypothetical protein